MTNKNKENNEKLNLLTIKELEDLLKISRRTIDRYCKNPDINFPKKIKIGKNSRFKRTEIEDWLENQRLVAMYTNNKIFNLNNKEEVNEKIILENLITKKEAIILLNKSKEFFENKELKLTCYKIGSFLYFDRSEITKKCNLKEKEYLLNKFKIEKEEDVQQNNKINKIFKKTTI
ncbi:MULTISPECIES: helix-turn-helix transcriptional regulator [unclassified Gilliamella]|uniref:helix-turn-helix transcriptional regulator n=1 Tax=unclassified Gilliamella TaxID=2685620 RepID=UPI0013273512|nr:MULTISPECIES: helix-turn-helix domain-containing protein [unclassified Gilliamella]MWN32312.1 helix-turn-helix domain-containing protein [Gilliamella sp. Pra-s60]MWP29530.1 helix-turn-helix domain-containing protein [Gilliamella sp. Pra-s54]